MYNFTQEWITKKLEMIKKLKINVLISNESFPLWMGKNIVKHFCGNKFNFSKMIFTIFSSSSSLACKNKRWIFMCAEKRKKSKHIESEVSGLINDSWSCLVVWFYKNKLLASRSKELFFRSHNQVQGNKSWNVEIKISNIFLVFTLVKLFLKSTWKNFK